MPDASRLPGRAPNLYEYLQVSPQADSGVIHAAYRALARRYHPDVNGGSDAARLMREINAAYHVLGDPQRRARYDAHRTRLTGRRPARRTSAGVVSTRLEPSSRGRGPARVAPLVAKPSQARTVVAAFLLTLVVVVVLFLMVVAIANLDDRPPNMARVVSAQPVLNRP
jgi:hypothetical protein